MNKIYLEYGQKINPEIWDPQVFDMRPFWLEDDDTDLKIRINDGYSVEHWWKSVYGFLRFSDRVLVGWITGHEAQQIEKLDPKEVGKIVTEKVLRKHLNCPEFPEPDNVVVTNWKSEQFTRGAYTFVHKNSSINDIEMMGKPIYSDPGQEKVRNRCLSNHA